MQLNKEQSLFRCRLAVGKTNDGNGKSRHSSHTAEGENSTSLEFNMFRCTIMKSVYLTFGLLVAFIVLIALTAQAQEQNKGSSRHAFRFPKIFNFDSFKRKFKKSYQSLIEEMARKKLYTTRAFRVFLSTISYKNRRSTSYLAVNQLSDLTPQELSRIYSEPKELENMKREEAYVGASLRLSDKGSRRKRDTMADLEDVTCEAKEQHNVQSPLSSDEASMILTYLPGHRNNALRSATSLFNLQDSDREPSELEHRKLPSEYVNVDHRESGCLFEPRDQQLCASCYAFAVLTIYEWSYCKATGEKVPFSEQYVIDCGRKVEYLNGCHGGWPSFVSKFINEYGVESRSRYPYKGIEESCPYEPSLERESYGYLRVWANGFEPVPVYRIEQELTKHPLQINMYVSDDFAFYGGGVDFPRCSKRNAHGMVIVGSGQEDGVGYWLIKNSLGVTWGLGGYYKMSPACAHCLMDGYVAKLNGFRVVKRAQTNESAYVDGLNKRHYSSIDEDLKEIEMQEQYSEDSDVFVNKLE